MAGRPHVSAALQHLRGWVVLCAVTVCVCAAARLVVFALVHYTDVRWVQLEPVETGRQLTVVQPGAAPEAPGESAVAEPRPDRWTARRASARDPGAGGAPAPAGAPRDANRVLSGADRMLLVASETASRIGAVAVVAIAVLTALGVAVAGGGAVVGVEKVVTACAWALVLCGLCLSWREGGGPGVFDHYDVMVRASDAADAGTSAGAGLTGRYVGLPIAACVVSGLVALWFVRGVAAGVILTSMSELEEAVEQEMASIRRKGALGLDRGGARAIGALNRALGDVEPGAPVPVAAAAPASTHEPEAPARMRGRPAGGDDAPRRPI